MIPKPQPRIRDKDASLRKLLADRTCRACGATATNCHHLIGKAQGGDDVIENLIPLCGSGSHGCHGALHGNPYTVQRGNWVLDVERRDARWVRQRIGLSLREAEYTYVIMKLAGDPPDPNPGAEHIRRLYHAEIAQPRPFFMRAA